MPSHRLITILNYTTLKPRRRSWWFGFRLITILNYTTLKPNTSILYLIGMFDYHLKLHYSQTSAPPDQQHTAFDYHLKLHYSQTHLLRILYKIQFDYHLKLHYSQTSNRRYKT